MAANETVLGKLHDAVAKVLTEAMQGQQVEGYIDPDTGEAVEGQVIPPSAALITVAAKFLKDNNITCEPAADNELGALQKIMEDRQKNLRGAKLDAADRAAVSEAAGFMGATH